MPEIRSQQMGLASRMEATVVAGHAEDADLLYNTSNARKSLTLVCVGPVTHRSPIASKYP